MQEYIQKLFQSASESESKMSRSFIFSGGHGSGKTSTARKIVQSHSYELLWLDTKQEKISVDHIRNIHEFVSKTSYSNKVKIVVIDSVDDLNISGANALLKPLEEPLGNCCFILISSNIKLVPSTIRSRCMNIRFSRPDGASSFDEGLYNQMLSALDVFTTRAEVLHNFIDSNFTKEDTSNKWQTFKMLIRHLTAQLVKYSELSHYQPSSRGCEAAAAIHLSQEASQPGLSRVCFADPRNDGRVGHEIVKKLAVDKSIMDRLALYTEAHKLIYYTDKLNLSVYNTVLLILYKIALPRNL